MGVEREDEMLDVKTAFEDVKDLQDQGEERDAAEDHRSEISDDAAEEEVASIAIRPQLLPRPLLDPAAKSRIVLTRAEAGAQTPGPSRHGFGGSGKEMPPLRFRGVAAGIGAGETSGVADGIVRLEDVSSEPT